VLKKPYSWLAAHVQALQLAAHPRRSTELEALAQHSQSASFGSFCPASERHHLHEALLLPQQMQRLQQLWLSSLAYCEGLEQTGIS